MGFTLHTGLIICVLHLTSSIRHRLTNSTFQAGKDIAPALQAGSRANFSSWQSYHDADAIISRITYLATSGTCAVPMTVKWQADSENAAKKLFTYSLGDVNAPKKILVAANAHGREIITGEIALRLAEVACDSSLEGHSKVASPLKAGSVRFIVVPIVNFEGRKIAEGSITDQMMKDQCLRETSASEGSLDLNRQGSVDHVPKEYHGSKPFIAYQARIIRDIAKREQPVAYIDLHSGARALLTPWSGRIGATIDYAAQAEMLKAVKEESCHDCAIGPGRATLGYSAGGTITDTLFAVHGIKYSSVWEVYVDNSAHFTQCRKKFNPPEKELLTAADNWVGALGKVANYVQSNVMSYERTSSGVLNDAPIVVLNGFVVWTPANNSTRLPSP